MNELRYTLKLIAKNIRFSMLCVSVIAIGVAIVLIYYSFASNMNGKKLPLERGDRYVTFDKTETGLSGFGGSSRYDLFHYNYFKENSTSFESLLAWRSLPVAISDGEYSESQIAAEIEPELLQGTGIQPILGRLFTSLDADLGSTPVAIIGFENWQNYYVANEDIIGLRTRINGVVRTIVGVMPEEFSFPISHGVWLPLTLASDAIQGGFEDLALVGILADGIKMSAASQEIQLLQARIKDTWTDEYAHIENSEVVVYFRIAGVGAEGTSMIFSIMVLLITLNAANLFFVRGEERLQELAIRSALGADHKKVAQALMLESFLVIFLGLLFGLAFAQLGISYIEGLINTYIPEMSALFWWDMSLDVGTLTNSLLVTTFIWLVSGGLPAWRVSRRNINEYVNRGGKGINEGGATRINKILVNAQLVISCMLLTVGVHQIMLNANGEYLTFSNSESKYTGHISYTREASNTDSSAQIYRSNLEQALDSQSGVADVTFTTIVPGSGGATVTYTIEDRDLLVNDVYPRQYALTIADNYFEFFDYALIEGRSFASEDLFGSLPVAIVDERLVDLLWPGESAVGKRLQINPTESSQWLTIVGVVEAINQGTIFSPGNLPVLYRPMSQENPFEYFIAFSSDNPGMDYQSVLGRAASEVNRDIPIDQMQSLTQIEEARASNQLFNRNLGFIIMAIAVYLSGITTYGLAARAAYRRRTEVGIRLALGARQIDCLTVILKDGLSMVLIGLSLGGALGILSVYASLTLGPSNVESLSILIPLTAIICFLMGGLVMLANYFPAKKIIVLEPGEALRHE